MTNTPQNQAHIEAFVAKSPELAKQVAALDWSELDKAIDECINNHEGAGLPEHYEPANYFPLTAENDAQAALYQKAIAHGEQLISAGKTAAFTVAGGQGTRLGYDGPKGTLPVSPIQNKSLFQLFAEQLAGLNAKFGCNIPWYIMCSPLNIDATTAHFKQNQFFGLAEDDVQFFTQGVMPATDFEGKLLVKDADNLALSPNGHGGSLKALIDSGSIDDMKNRGVEHLSYFQVDNPLISIISPLFVGLHDLQNSDMSSRSLTKTGPFEKLGNFVMVGDSMTIIEYSDLPDEKALETDNEGRIKYRAGSPAMHLIRRDFIDQFADASLKLPYHRAEKKVPFINLDGEAFSPEEANAVKFETFVFDALHLAKNPLILEALREEDFSPVKNKTGVDSLESCQADQIKRDIKRLRNLGIEVSDSAVVEIAPALYIDDKKLKVTSPQSLEAGHSYYLA
jgi:UDP-N-acetylglucosamine/UDP-N-acetylgalactosamine diphosphorylase